MSDETRKMLQIMTLVTLVVTFIICTVIFIFLNKTETDLAAMSMDLPITVAFTGLIGQLVAVFQHRSAAKKGTSAPVPQGYRHLPFHMLPKNIPVYIIAQTILGFLFFAGGPIGILYIFAPDIVMPRMAYVMFKALCAAVTSSFVMSRAAIYMSAVFAEKAAVTQQQSR